MNSTRKSLKVFEKFKDFDRVLLTRFTNMRLNKKQITGALMVQKLRKMLKFNGEEIPSDAAVGRLGTALETVSFYRAKGLHVEDLDCAVFNDWLKNALLKPYRADDVFNGDETALFFSM